MIIDWNKEGAGLLTVSKLKDNKIVKTISILPGHNEISDEDWNGIKAQLKDKIEEGTIKEVVLKVKKEVEKGGRKATVERTITEIKDFPAEKAVEIVNDTFDLDTLEKWQKKEGRDEIRAAIAEQIKHVENPNLKKGKKSKKKK